MISLVGTVSVTGSVVVSGVSSIGCSSLPRALSKLLFIRVTTPLSFVNASLMPIFLTLRRPPRMFLPCRRFRFMLILCNNWSLTLFLKVFACRLFFEFALVLRFLRVCDFCLSNFDTFPRVNFIDTFLI